MKYLFTILLIGNTLNACQYPSLNSRQKLSLLRSIRDGKLKIHSTMYEYPHIETSTSESTFFVHKIAAHSYLEEFLKTDTYEREYFDDFKADRDSYANKHPELFNDESCSQKVEDEYLILFVKAFKSYRDITHDDSIRQSVVYQCIKALINNNSILAQKYLASLYQYYLETQTCVIL